MKTKLKILRNWRRGLRTCVCAGKLSVPCLLPNKTGNRSRDNAVNIFEFQAEKLAEFAKVLTATHF